MIKIMRSLLFCSFLTDNKVEIKPNFSFYLLPPYLFILLYCKI